jgi:undecaprenyl-phosphate galactose phosphotransferase
MSVESQRVLEGFGGEGVGPQTIYQECILKLPKLNLAARLGRSLAPLILVAIDYLAVVLALVLSDGVRQIIMKYFLEVGPFTLNPVFFFFTIPLVYLGFISYEKLYTKRMPFWQCTEKFLKISTYSSVVLIGLLFFSGWSASFSRLFLVSNWLISFVVLVVFRYIGKRLMVRSGLWRKPVLFLGSSTTAELIQAAFEEEPNMGYQIAGVIDDHPARGRDARFPVHQNMNDVESMLKSSDIQDVMIAADGIKREQLIDLVNRIQPLVKSLVVIPDLIGVPMSNMEVNTLLNQKVILLNTKNNLTNAWNILWKRLFDLVAGTLIAILATPLILLIALWIRLDSKGPAFYNAKRIGKNGREFICYKFRTMHVNGDALLDEYFDRNPEAREEWERFAKLKTADPRVTRAGRFLRRFSLDELPQVYNVLLGNMSLVGPRPYLPREKEKMGYYYDTIIETVPGITGLWQTGGRNDVEFEGRLGMDSWYVRNWSFWLDVILLLKTVKVVLGKRGAY